MSEEPEGREETTPIEVGDPERGGDDAQRGPAERERPDLDERQRRIGEERRPMGPPLRDTQDRGPGGAVPPSAQDPTDPE